MLDTNPLSRLEYLWLVMQQKPSPAVPTLRVADAAGNTLDVNVDQPLLHELAAGDSLPNVPLLDNPLPDVPLPDVPPPNVSLPDAPVPESCPVGSVVEE
jgi:hypothetical protein